MPDTFSNRLKEAMETNNITQSELCAKTGIPKSALSQYLSGKYNAKDDRIALLAQTLNVHPLWLHGFDLPFDEAQLFLKYPKIRKAVDEENALINIMKDFGFSIEEKEETTQETGKIIKDRIKRFSPDDFPFAEKRYEDNENYLTSRFYYEICINNKKIELDLGQTDTLVALLKNVLYAALCDNDKVIEKYLKLDDRDKGKIEEKIDTLLENEKYTQDTPPQNAKAT